MFEQFRSYFPRGCLISELVQIDHGKYIVRASVQNEGLTLATGLAAADTVEKAEDQARTRALAVLDISLTPAQPPSRSSAAAAPPQQNTSPGTEGTSVSSQATSSRFQNRKQQNASQVPAASSTPDDSQGKEESGSDIALAQSEISQPEAEAVQQKQDRSISQAACSAQDTDAGDGEEKYSPSQPEATSVGSASHGGETAMDYSDIIARTNVELKRLRWTNEQGRKFLEETYGKRSRSLLSESELLEFLQYLEKQPTPPQDS